MHSHEHIMSGLLSSYCNILEFSAKHGKVLFDEVDLKAAPNGIVSIIIIFLSFFLSSFVLLFFTETNWTGYG